MKKAFIQKSNHLGEKIHVVIGGGIIGSTQAYYLSQNPQNKVILIDQNKACGLGTTKANSCMLMINNTFPYTQKSLWEFFPRGFYSSNVIQKIYLKCFTDPGFIKFFYYWIFKANAPFKDSDQNLNLNKLNFDLIRQFIQVNNINVKDIDFQDDCHYANLYTVDDNKKESFITKQMRITRFNRQDFLDKEGIQEFVWKGHPEVKGLDKFNICIYEPLLKVNSMKITQAIQQILEKLPNVELHLNSEVVQLNHDKKSITSVHLNSSKSQIKGDNFYICTGPQTSTFLSRQLKLRVPVVPIKGYSFEFKCPSKNTQVHLKMPQGYGIVATYLQDDIIRISGFGDITGLNTEIDQKRMEYMKSVASQFYDEKLIFKESFNEWCGMRPCTPDDKAIVGNLKPFSNLMINVGHGGRGLTQGFATSQIIAKMVNETNLDQEFREKYIEPFSPQRFNL